MKAEHYIRQKAEKAENLTVDTLCKLNALLNGADNDELEGGKLPTEGVMAADIGGLFYPSPLDVPPLVTAIVSEVNEGLKRQENPILLAASAYQKLVSLHPFNDGNGRTCRLIMDYILIRSGLPPATLTDEEIEVAIFGDQDVSSDETTPKTPTTAVNYLISGLRHTQKLCQS